MSVYIRIAQGLVAGGMTPGAAAAELAALRKDIGTELSAGVLAHAQSLYKKRPNDTDAMARKKKVRFSAMRAAADWIAQATTTGRLTTAPHQRTNRSTT